MRRTTFVREDLGARRFSPAPGSAAVVEVDMRRQHPSHSPGIKPRTLKPAPYFRENYGRPRINQRDGSVPGLQRRDADDLGSAKVVGIDDVNPHPIPLYRFTACRECVPKRDFPLFREERSIIGNAF
jgi:hypothetical protein